MKLSAAADLPWNPMQIALARSLVDLRTVLLASDPALSRLRMGARVTLTLMAVGLALIGLHRLIPLPIAAYSVMVITAMQGTLVVRDATSRARAVTRLYSGLTGFAAVAVATLFSPWSIVSDAVFVLFVFGAVYARKYGARGNAIGMFAFMCYFAGAYLHPSIADLASIALTIMLSGIIAHGIRNYVLPERREQDFRHTIVAIGQRLATQSALLKAGAARGWTAASRREVLRQQERIGDAILTAEGFLPPIPSDAHREAAVRELTIALFDLHLASETA
ncbi:MAG: FUSC family protein, partial [Hyphomicrobiales bacterium]